MGATSKLLALYRVDQQLTGLKSRLKSAERYLKQQDAQLADIDARHDAVRSQLRQLEATAHNNETELRGYDDRIASLRERMNTASTSKEHSALLTEVNTVKADKAAAEEKGLETLESIEALRAQLAELEQLKSEREKVRKVAQADRDERSSEISGRVAELEKRREEALSEVPPSALAEYDALVEIGVEEPMAPVEEQDRRNKEYACGACYTHLPVEQVSVLLNRSDIVKCTSCGVILFIQDELRDSLETAAEKRRKKRAAETA